jgi:SAM-dependent methyltransferase
MYPAAEVQPDQRPLAWDLHTHVYEAVFEPLSNAFGKGALDLLTPQAGQHLIDVGAGSGGVALLAAQRGLHVLAVDASAVMVERIHARAQASAPDRIQARPMDGTALAVQDCSFDLAISVFGVILFPDAPRGMAEIARVLKPGGRTAIVTWTESERYELVGRMVAAITKVRGPQPAPTSLPAQLRFREPETFRALLCSGGLSVDVIVREEHAWRLPSARWLAERLAFAPGMSAMLGALGDHHDAVIERFVADLEADQGTGEINLCAVAQIGVATKPKSPP